MLFVKFGNNRLHRFRGDVVWKCWQTDEAGRRATDACLYYKLTFGSDELIKVWSFGTVSHETIIVIITILKHSYKIDITEQVPVIITYVVSFRTSRRTSVPRQFQRQLGLAQRNSVTCRLEQINKNKKTKKKKNIVVYWTILTHNP